MTNGSIQSIVPTRSVPQGIELNRFKLPIVIGDDSEYLVELERMLRLFLTDIEQFHNVNEIIYGRTQENVDKILRAINCHYDGDIPTARQLIFEVLEPYKGNPFIISSLDDSPAFRGITRLKWEVQQAQQSNQEMPSELHPMGYQPLSFFKARTGTEGFGKRDFLHIPFDKRGIVSTQRFSIAGVPCMYFGATSYVSWLELGKPADNEFNVSSYKVPGETKVLNLAITQHLINGLAAFNDDWLKDALSLIELFPLIIATSYKVRDNNRSFKSEYIISQLVMQCLPLLDTEGVAYISKRVDDDSFNTPICVNVAVPMKKSNGKYSEFANNIFLTEPVNYAEYKKILRFPASGSRIASFGSAIEQGITCLGKQIPYQHHEFCAFDNYLVSEHHSPTI
ncbi:hypothetical protein BK744_21695 [Bacillus thuringiensis serovar zhaodongensis]|uniref:hypothetical protein n=1 Tax=Bacillus cereus group TaxID=86661 RepID=UPI0007F98096|nr:MULTISPECIES: hypothetical protein [Bacillus cereus group]MEB9661552.1 hypothetical protein [Bacillus cereus]ARV91167.1 hypothetical protein BJG91_00360 [Bacillus thuringiensis]OTY23220.1 hypothetical protein BK738_26740 [Bacillus thuringiensis serovar rongseni]OUB69781.1 hypothetical protein BK744_21695 [Bacillus thuringiensis serovar zhaodongensis]GIX60461.1 hypothetical protein BPADB04_54910 [Bacillus paranthracis]